MSVSLASAGATASAGVAGSPYAITVDDATGSGLPNYTITYVNGSLAVVPAPLIITANDLSRAYGAANPTLTATYSGFVDGEPAASLTTPVVLGTTAVADSPAGPTRSSPPVPPRRITPSPSGRGADRHGGRQHDRPGHVRRHLDVRPVGLVHGLRLRGGRRPGSR